MPAPGQLAYAHRKGGYAQEHSQTSRHAAVKVYQGSTVVRRQVITAINQKGCGRRDVLQAKQLVAGIYITVLFHLET